MKLEFDLNDRNKLLALREEHRRAVAILDVAIGNQGEEKPSDLPTRVIDPQVLAEFQREPVMMAVSQLPEQFTASQVYGILGAGFDRNEAKMGLRAAVECGLIRLLQKGQGRRPSTYEKILRQQAA